MDWLIILGSLFMSTIWWIWRQRNILAFGETYKGDQCLLSKICRMVEDMRQAWYGADVSYITSTIDGFLEQAGGGRWQTWFSSYFLEWGYRGTHQVFRQSSCYWFHRVCWLHRLIELEIKHKKFVTYSCKQKCCHQS